MNFLYPIPQKQIPSQALKFISKLLNPLLLATTWLIVCGTDSSGGESIRLLPGNRHYFEFRGKPVVLIGASEHYGALINLDFDYIRYLDEVAACGLNVVRVFSGAYRETPGAFSIEENTLNPLQGRFLAPWARSNIPGASDGGNKFDLTRWDAAYFHRLCGFVKAAGERNIVVELTLFCPFYDESLWSVSPMKSTNHINGVGAGGFSSCHQVNSDLLPFQKALARKCAEELNSFDNVFFEIVNEPYIGGIPLAWQSLIIDELVATEASLPRPHLISQNIANHDSVITNPHPSVSIFNFHYAYPNATLANQGLNRVIGDDETGFAGTTDFPYRREAWEFMLAGGGLFDHLDFSFTMEREDGIASPPAPGGGGPAIRRQLGVLRWLLEELPLIRCAPQTGLITGGVPSGGSVRVLGSPGEAYLIYVRGGTQANLVANLPAGTYRGRWIDPRSSAVSARLAEFTHAGGSRTLSSPVYGEDMVLLMFGGTLPPPEVTLTEPVYQTVAAADSVVILKAAMNLENGTVDRVEFLDGDRMLGSVSAPPYVLALNQMTRGNHIFRARAVASDGRNSLSPPVKCTLMGTFQSAVNLNGPAVELNGQSWLSNAGALVSGMKLTNTQTASTSPALPIYPAPDPLTRTLVSSQILRLSDTNNSELAVAYPVPNGTYDIFFSLVEGQTAYSRDVRVSIEGIVVARGIGDMALGEWVNYGPYRAIVSDGILNLVFVDETKGSPKIANFSIYQANAPLSAADAYLDIGVARGVAVLSWQGNVPAGKMETSTSLQAAEWQPLNMAAEDFTDHQEIAVPMTEARRFFRLRKE
jgi:hypothetical protein